MGRAASRVPGNAGVSRAAGPADVVLPARKFLSDPSWPIHAARALGAAIAWPLHYQRAKH